MCVEKVLQVGLSVFTLSTLVKNSEAVEEVNSMWDFLQKMVEILPEKLGSTL